MPGREEKKGVKFENENLVNCHVKTNGLASSTTACSPHGFDSSSRLCVNNFSVYFQVMEHVHFFPTVWHWQVLCDSFCQSWLYICVVVDVFDSELKICDH